MNTAKAENGLVPLSLAFCSAVGIKLPRNPWAKLCGLSLRTSPSRRSRLRHGSPDLAEDSGSRKWRTSV
jgi:hypothetical protein